MTISRVVETAKRGVWLAYHRNRLIRVSLSPMVLARRAFFGNARQHQLKVIDHLGRILSDAPQVRLPHFRGTFFVEARSDMFKRVALGDSYEEALAGVVERGVDTNKDAIDVGANCGFYTVLLARMLPGRKVISVEPTDGALKLLRRNIELNCVEGNVTVFQGVATDKEGSANLNVIEGREEYSTLGGIVHPSVILAEATSRSIRVAATTVDHLVISTGISCGFIKIDVEGHECAVLKGARETLLNHRPLVLAELADPLLRSNGSSALEVIHFMKDLNYNVVDPGDPAITPGKKAYGDILCIPQ